MFLYLRDQNPFGVYKEHFKAGKSQVGNLWVYSKYISSTENFNHYDFRLIKLLFFQFWDIVFYYFNNKNLKNQRSAVQKILNK